MSQRCVQLLCDGLKLPGQLSRKMALKLNGKGGLSEILGNSVVH